MSTSRNHFPVDFNSSSPPFRPEGDLRCPLCGRPPPGKTFAPSNSLLLKLLLGWLFDLPNFPDGLFFVEVTEADIDHQEYSLTLATLNTHYGHLCGACLSPSLHTLKEAKADTKEIEAIPSEQMSPTKSTSQAHGQGQTLTATPSKQALQGIYTIVTDSIHVALLHRYVNCIGGNTDESCCSLISKLLLHYCIVLIRFLDSFSW